MGFLTGKETPEVSGCRVEGSVSGVASLQTRILALNPWTQVLLETRFCKKLLMEGDTPFVEGAGAVYPDPCPPGTGLAGDGVPDGEGDPRVP